MITAVTVTPQLQDDPPVVVSITFEKRSDWELLARVCGHNMSIACWLKQDSIITEQQRTRVETLLGHLYLYGKAVK